MKTIYPPVARLWIKGLETYSTKLVRDPERDVFDWIFPAYGVQDEDEIEAEVSTRVPDENGQIIYEGDIVVPTKNHPLITCPNYGEAEIVLNDGTFLLCARYTGEPILGSTQLQALVYDYKACVRVIGQKRTSPDWGKK